VTTTHTGSRGLADFREQARNPGYGKSLRERKSDYPRLKISHSDSRRLVIADPYRFAPSCQ
jgi:hypothetical protein